jgi:hypothetical protein
MVNSKKPNQNPMLKKTGLIAAAIILVVATVGIGSYYFQSDQLQGFFRKGKMSNTIQKANYDKRRPTKSSEKKYGIILKKLLDEPEDMETVYAAALNSDSPIVNPHYSEYMDLNLLLSEALNLGNSIMMKYHNGKYTGSNPTDDCENEINHPDCNIYNTIGRLGLLRPSAGSANAWFKEQYTREEMAELVYYMIEDLMKYKKGSFNKGIPKYHLANPPATPDNRPFLEKIGNEKFHVLGHYDLVDYESAMPYYGNLFYPDEIMTEASFYLWMENIKEKLDLS